jgi:glutamyl-tRNA reductase
LLDLHRKGVLVVTSAGADNSPVLDSEVSGMIVSLRERFEGVRRDVMQRVCGRFGNLSSEQRNAIEALTHGIIEKVLEAPMAMLKNACPRDQSIFVLETVRRIFNLRM